MKDYYKILDISNTADDFAIKAAYKRLASQYHFGFKSSLEFIEIKDAYETLLHGPSRISYDLAVKVFNSPHTKNKSVHKFSDNSNVSRKQSTSIHSFVKDLWTKTQDKLMHLYIGFVIVSLIVGTFSSTTINPQHRYIVDQEIFETNPTKPSNIPFVDNDKQTKTVSDPLANRFLTELSKSQILAYGRANR